MTQLDRRSVVTAGLVAAGALIATSAQAGDAKKDAKKEPDAPAAAAVDPKLKAVLDSTSACLAAGRVCMARCTDHLAHGMAAMADCQKAVMNMIAVCEAMESTAAYNTTAAKLLKQMAATCGAFCRACEKACEPHMAKHAECKACGDACKSCATACEAYAA